MPGAFGLLYRAGQANVGGVNTPTFLGCASEPVSRRRFLGATAALWGLAQAAEPEPPPRPKRRYRAAIVGFTGGGNYGHGYDQVFRGLDNVETVAVADPDEAGRKGAMERAGAPRGYADYVEMLRQEQPDLVAIASRHPRTHLSVALMAIERGAGLFVEKPFTETVADADRVLAAAARRGCRIVVAHNRRYDPEFAHLKRLLADGFVGHVREVRIQGKQDRRAGGEDLVVLGSHDFDLLRFFFGDPLWCQASILVEGRLATRDHIREGREPIRVVGDTVRAQFGFAGNVAATWSSVTLPGDWNQPKGPREHWAFEILGTRRIVAYQSRAGFACLDSPYLLPQEGISWGPLPAPTGPTIPVHRRTMALDLIHAIETGESPRCSGEDGRWAIEMIAAVYQSHFTRGRVVLPLRQRTDPLRAG